MKKIISVILMIQLLSCSLYANGNSDSSTNATWIDVHGAGSQRSDPKTGDASQYSDGFGPQGDSIRIDNYARAVRLISSADLSYPIVDTNQTTRFNNYDVESNYTKFVGQDADYTGLEMSYTDNGDGTITDNITGLMWQQDPGQKMTWSEAHDYLESINLAGYDDWRIPTIKELYSLIQFSGRDISPNAQSANQPFINTNYFNFSYGDTTTERIIDSQYMSSTKYVSTTMIEEETVFGVNFADGRIKGYGMRQGNRQKEFYVIFVRGNEDYGENNFIDNRDGTITDLSTGLMWMQNDSGAMQWEDALVWAEGLNYAGYSDWRLPDVKELQSIVDYSRSPDTSNSPAIDPIFNCSEIVNEAGEIDYGFYWSSTTHANSSARNSGGAAAYVSFGRSLGNLANFEMQDMTGNDNRGPQGRMGPPPQRRN